MIASCIYTFGSQLVEFKDLSNGTMIVMSTSGFHHDEDANNDSCPWSRRVGYGGFEWIVEKTGIKCFNYRFVEAGHSLSTR